MVAKVTRLFVASLLILLPLPALGGPCVQAGYAGCADFCGTFAICSPGCISCSGYINFGVGPGGGCTSSGFWSLDLSLTRINSLRPGTGWEIGTRYSVALASSTPFDIQNGAVFGASTDENLSITHIGATFELGDSKDPDTRIIIVTDLDVTIPSFAHSAIAPDATGTNTYRLEPGCQSVGSVNIHTGLVSDLKIRAEMFNAYFSNEPAKVLVEIGGTFDLSASSGSLTLEGMIYDEDSVYYP